MTDGPTSRTTVRRLPHRASYDRAVIDAILDEALICHVGFVDDGPVVIPTIHARVGDHVYIHGSAASRMLRNLAKGADACLTATLVDGIVLAKSHFHSSMNYRSVVVMGRTRLVADPEEKDQAFAAIAEKMEPGRWDGARKPTDKESRATLVIAMTLDETSAKVRTGGPVDEPEDMALPHWSGVIPLHTVRGEPLPE